jgi:hypothetical protein
MGQKPSVALRLVLEAPALVGASFYGRRCRDSYRAAIPIRIADNVRQTTAIIVGVSHQDDGGVPSPLTGLTHPAGIGFVEAGATKKPL